MAMTTVSMSAAVSEASAVVYSLKDDNGSPITQLRLADGYLNLTAMSTACHKKVNNYTRSKGAQEYLAALSQDLGLEPDVLLQHQYTSGGAHATWGHPELAVDVANWCSVRFRLKVNRLVTRYYRGELTSEESRAAAELLPQVVQPVQRAVDVVEWKGKREVAKQLTKAKSSKIHQVTGGKAKGFTYGNVNQALTKSVVGKTPAELKTEHKWKKGDNARNYMPVGMLSLLNWGEDRVDHELEKAYAEAGRFLTDAEVQGVAMRVTDNMFELCSSTGGFDVPLLKETPVAQKRKVAGNLLAPAKQQKLIACH